MASENLTATKGTQWQISKSVDMGTVTKTNVTKTTNITLPTAGQYLDRDITISVENTAKTPGSAVLATSGTASSTVPVSVGAKASGKYPFTGSANITGTSSASTLTGGYAEKDVTSATGSVTGTAGVSGSMDAIGLGASGTGSATIDSVTVGAYDATNKRYPLTGSKAISGTASASVTSAGYGTVGVETGSGSVTGTASLSAYMTRAAIGVAESKPTGYEENTTAVVPSAGYLTIDAGYMPKTIISLATLVPNQATITNNATGAATMRTGTTAYDKDGNLITGTMNNASVKSGDITHTLGAPTYNTTSGKFDQSCTIDAAAPTVVSSGFISDTDGTKSAATQKTENHALDKIAGTIAISGTKTYTPEIAKQAISISGVTDAADGNATTTAPTSGAYIKIKSAAKTGNVSAAATINTAGYGTNAAHGIAGSGNVAVGANASADTYVKVKSGSASVTADTISVSGGTPTKNETTGKYDITLSGSKTINGSATAGWVTSVTGATVSASGTKSLDAAVLTHGSASGTAGTVTPTATATKVTTSESATAYYVTSSGTAASGTIKHNASVSAGYTEGDTIEATITATPSVGTNKVTYLASTTLTNTVSAAVSGASTGYNAPVTVAASTTVPQLKMTGSGSGAVNSVLSSNGTADNKYINYFTGSYTVEVV